MKKQTLLFATLVGMTISLSSYADSATVYHGVLNPGQSVELYSHNCRPMESAWGQYFNIKVSDQSQKASVNYHVNGVWSSGTSGTVTNTQIATLDNMQSNDPFSSGVYITNTSSSGQLAYAAGCECNPDASLCVPASDDVILGVLESVLHMVG